MKKFNDILNENAEGEVDNTVAVSLIVKDFDFLHKFLFKYLQEKADEVAIRMVSNFSDFSFTSTILYDSNKEPYLKYLGVTFKVSLFHLFAKETDVSIYFTELRSKFSESFKLKGNAIYKEKSTEDFRIQIDYEDFLKSDLYKSLKGIDKYNL